MSHKIGFIGVGNMGTALIKGIIESKTLEAANINAFDVVESQVDRIAKRFGINKCRTLQELVKSSDTILIAVKPQNVPEVISSIRSYLQPDQLIISIAAGISINYIQELIGFPVPIIRVMPNTPALVLEGATALAKNSLVSKEQIEKAMKLFNAVGYAWEVEEKLMNAITGLSGSGPAYILLFLEALTDGGVLSGLPRNLARNLVIQTAIGTLKMIKEKESHFAELKDMVTSPAGTTIHALEIMEKNGLRGIIMEAVKRATDRAEELQTKQ